MHIKDGFGRIIGIAGLGLSLLTGSAFGQYASMVATEEYVDKKVGSATNLVWKAVETNNAEIAAAQDTADRALEKAAAADENAVAALFQAKITADNLSTNYYTKTQTDEAIDAMSAYYITADAEGNAFESYAALTNTTVYYSGGVVRVPTRNDYAVVLADETHGGTEWRYIYAVPDGATTGQWEAQYPIETNDYEALANKPQINGHTLTNNQTGADLGLLDLAGGTMTGALTLAEVDGSNTEIIKAFLGSDSAQKFVIGVCGGDFYIGQYGHRLWLPYTSDTLALLSQIGIPAFDSTAQYAVGAKVVYNSAVWNCTTRVSIIGEWTGSANWTKIFDLATDSTPTASSSALMTSGALKTALDAKASRAPNPTAGNLAALDANGNPIDSSISKTDVATKTDVDNKANRIAFAQDWSIRDWYEWMEGDWAWYNGLLYRATRDLDEDIDPDIDPDTPGEADKHKPGATNAWILETLNDVQTIGGIHRAKSFIATNDQSGREVYFDSDGVACQENGYGGLYFPDDGMPRIVVTDDAGNERTYKFATGHEDGEEVTVAITAGTGHDGNLAALDADGNPTDSGLSKGEVEYLLFAQYYPDGNVKSAAEFTQGIKYGSFDAVNRTVSVLPFCNTGTAADDNSNLSGCVVIPPFVDASGNPYISDDGTRYKVVGVSDGEQDDDNDNLTTIVAPNTVTGIGERAFHSCTMLSTVSLPAATTIGDYAFTSCAGLTSVSLPAATTIGNYAFVNCKALTSISLPAATTIGGGVFNSCSSIASVDFGDTPRSSVPSLGTGAFYHVPNTCKIIVPAAQYDAWIAATNWSTLYADGYKFLKHSEWEYARRYELDAKQDALTAQQLANIAAVPNKVDKMESIAWADLKTKRDGGTLVPSQEYRITNYVATTIGDMNSRSANHPFDIIVVADATNVLNETARAIQHTASDDDYFYGCNLAAWKIQYCLDNDTSRFVWAVADNATGVFDGDAPFTGGRGIIYRMVDEFNNDVPYDFKGIQFQRWAVTNITSTKLTADAVSSLSAQFVYSQNGNKCFAYQNSDIEVEGTTMTVDSANSAFYYTFDTGSGGDNSKDGYSTSVYGNLIGAYVESAVTHLNGIVFLGNYCGSNIFGNDCFYNTFGGECCSNTFGDYCSANTFGNYCLSNTFGNDCIYNTFGAECCSNTFGDECYSNTFGDYCSANTFGDECYSNIFGNDCFYNTFGAECCYNTFGGECYSNTFGDYCSANTFGDGTNLRSYYQYITFESGVQYVNLNCTNATEGAYYRNVTLKSGIAGTEDNPKLITDAVGQAPHTTYQPANSQVISVP